MAGDRDVERLLKKRVEDIDAPALIQRKCAEILAMLLEKDAAYGSSVAKPLRCFADKSLTPAQMVEVRLDDKLSRLMRGHQMPDESKVDTIKDIVGYLIWLLILEDELSEKGPVDAG